MNTPPMSMKGNWPDSVVYGVVSYLVKMFEIWVVIVSSGAWLRSSSSFALKSMYGLEYVALWNVKVSVFASTSVDEDWISDRFLNVPKRDSHITMTQRSAAQYGQYSAPTKTTNCLPSVVTSFADAGRRIISPGCLPEPTVSTTVWLGLSTAVRIAFGTVVATVAFPPPAALITTITMRTIAT